jgi:hypothetical protein
MYIYICDLLVNFFDIHGNDVDISIETVETLEEIETKSNGSGSCDSSEESCADKSTQQDRSLHSAVMSRLCLNARKVCTNLWYKRFRVQKK